MDPPDWISHGLFVFCLLVLYNTYQYSEQVPVLPHTPLLVLHPR